MMLLICGCLFGCGVPQGDPGPAPATRVASPGNFAADSQCAACHHEIAASYAQHPMGRSLEEITADGTDSQLPAAQLDAPRFHYSSHWQSPRLIHRQDVRGAAADDQLDVEWPVRFAVGSGRRGRSYFVERDGFLNMSPMTWYGQQRVWGLSPGYEQRNAEFHRPVVAECLFCHANFSTPIPSSENRYRTPLFPRGCAIGCQRCHGPGEDHVHFHEAAEPGSVSHESVVPASDPLLHLATLPAVERDAICQQCHQSGAVRILAEGKQWHDFRPGERLDGTIQIFDWSHASQPAAHFVGHFEQMYASRCFAASQGTLTCISCHDPHRTPSEAERVQYFVQRCESCHDRQACTETPERRAATVPANNCLVCHMPRQTTEVQHAATTDHRIPRRPIQPESPSDTDVAEAPRLMAVRRPGDTTTLSAAALDRNHALAVVQLRLSGDARIDESDVLEAVRTLQAHLTTQSRDLAAWDALARAAMDQQNADLAYSALRELLQRNPTHEAALSNMAHLMAAIGKVNERVTYAQQARDSNPWHAGHWFSLASAWHDRGDYASTLQLADEALQRFPTSMGLRHLRVSSLLQLGRHQEAADAMQAIERFEPAEWKSLQRWYQQHPLRKPQ